MKIILNNLRDNWIKYGFETLAVTVGILGAFALENWKDKTLEEQELLEIYRAVSEDLHADILALDTILGDFEWRISTMNQILTEPLSMDDWVSNDSLAGSFIGYPDFLEKQRGLNLLKTKIAVVGETGLMAGQIISFSMLENDHSPLVEYAKDNPNFRNRITIYMAVVRSHYRYLNIYKEEGAILMDAIDAFLDETRGPRKSL